MLFPILIISFLFNGEHRNVYLTSPTYESCIRDARAAKAILNNIGAISVSTHCTFEGAHE
jgi:hypothetical protein